MHCGFLERHPYITMKSYGLLAIVGLAAFVINGVTAAAVPRSRFRSA